MQPMSSAAPAPRESAGRPPRVSRRRIAVNFLTLAGTNVFGLLVTILISVYVRRAMGPEAIGQVSWAMAAVAYLTVLVSPGLTFVGQRGLAQSPEKSQSVIALRAHAADPAGLRGLRLRPGGGVARTARTRRQHAARHPGRDAVRHAPGTPGWALQAHERMVVAEPGGARLQYLCSCRL